MALNSCRSFIFTYLLTVGLAVEDNFAAAHDFCSFVKSFVAASHDQACATEFCSSYFGITPPTVVRDDVPEAGETIAEAAPTTTVIRRTTITEPQTRTVTTTIMPTVVITTTITTGKTDTTLPLTICGKPTALEARVPAPDRSCMPSFSNSDDHVSACRCLGVSAHTTTQVTKNLQRRSTKTIHNGRTTVTQTYIVDHTKTVTTSASTQSSTVTKLVEATATVIGPFYIGASGDSAIANQYVTCPSSGGGFPCKFQAPQQMADKFVQQPDDHVVDKHNNPVHLRLGIPGGGSTPYQVISQASDGNGFPRISCEISPGTSGMCSMSCTVVGDGTTNTVESVCDTNAWQLGPNVTAGCNAINLFVVPA